jgi:hypothetical protein
MPCSPDITRGFIIEAVSLSPRANSFFFSEWRLHGVQDAASLDDRAVGPVLCSILEDLREGNIDEREFGFSLAERLDAEMRLFQ